MTYIIQALMNDEELFSFFCTQFEKLNGFIPKNNWGRESMICWCEAQQKHSNILNAWNIGETIQFRLLNKDNWVDCKQNPLNYPAFYSQNYEWRIL